MAKKMASALMDDSADQKDKREYVRGLFKNNPSLSTKEVADALLTTGRSVPDHADKSEKGSRNWTTFTVWVSSQKRVALNDAAPTRGQTAGSLANALGDLELAAVLSEAAGGTETAIKFLEVVAKLPDIGLARKSLQKLKQLQEALGEDGAKKAVNVLFGRSTGGG
jgi:hypothetical protein